MSCTIDEIYDIDSATSEKKLRRKGESPAIFLALHSTIYDDEASAVLVLQTQPEKKP